MLISDAMDSINDGPDDFEASGDDLMEPDISDSDEESNSLRTVDYREDDKFTYEILTTDQIFQHMNDALKEVNSVVAVGCYCVTLSCVL